TFGPLCELAVTEGLATEVLVSSFEVSKQGRGTVVEWTTASEAGTIGYRLYRLDRSTGELLLVSDGLLPANVGAGQGGRYRYVDSKASDDPRPAYVLEEITAQGAHNRYGPFVGTSGRVSAPRSKESFEGEPRKMASKKPAFASDSFSVASDVTKANAVAAMVGVRTTGIVRVTSSDLASVLKSD